MRFIVVKGVNAKEKLRLSLTHNYHNNNHHHHHQHKYLQQQQHHHQQRQHPRPHFTRSHKLNIYFLLNVRQPLTKRNGVVFGRRR